MQRPICSPYDWSKPGEGLTQLKKLVADLSLDKEVLQDVLRKKF